MAKPTPKAPAASVALYEALIATNPNVERKGATMPYTSINGNMYSVLTADGTLALRLPEGEREEFLKRYKTTLSVQYGVVMKEYVKVPVAVLAKTRELARYLDVSHRYAASLKAKATARSAGKSSEQSRTKRADGTARKTAEKSATKTARNTTKK